MIIQIPGKRYISWFEKHDTNPVINYSHSPAFPSMTEVLEWEYEETYLHRKPSYHRPSVVKTLPEPNNAVRSFENSRHVWHFKETETGIEFIFISDGLRKNHYKGSSVEVIAVESNAHKNDNLLAKAYKALLTYFSECYKKEQLDG